MVGSYKRLMHNLAETAAVQRLADAVRKTERHHPLPRCIHGKALRDRAGEILEPMCGCRAESSVGYEQLTNKEGL